jgi:hypothetical protein
VLHTCTDTNKMINFGLDFLHFACPTKSLTGHNNVNTGLSQLFLSCSIATLKWLFSSNSGHWFIEFQRVTIMLF